MRSTFVVLHTLCNISTDNHYYEKFDDGTVNDITDEIPFDIPDSWCWCRLKYISKIITGYSFKSTEFNENKSIRVIRISDFDESGLKNNSFVKIDDSKKYDNYVIENNSILIAMTGGTVGKSVLLSDLREKLYLNQRVACITSNEYINYLLLIIQSSYIKDIINYSKNSTNDNISMNLIENFLIPFPCLNEQLRILKKYKMLEPYFSKYNKYFKNIEVLNANYKEELKKSILQYAIQGKLVKQNEDDEPASKLIERIIDEKHQMMKDKKIKKENLSIIYKDTDNQFYEKFDDGTINNITDEIPFDIPDTWVWTRLRNISSIISKGTTPKGGRTAYLASGVNFLRAENVKDNGVVSLRNVMYIDEKIHNNFLKRSILEEKDILICIAGTLGRCAIIEKGQLPANTNQAVSFVRYIDKNEYFVRYSQLAISSFEIQRSLIKKTKVTAIPNLTLEIIGNCLLPLPPIGEQIRIVAQIDKLLNLMQ